MPQTKTVSSRNQEEKSWIRLEGVSSSLTQEQLQHELSSYISRKQSLESWPPASIQNEDEIVHFIVKQSRSLRFPYFRLTGKVAKQLGVPSPLDDVTLHETLLELACQEVFGRGASVKHARGNEGCDEGEDQGDAKGSYGGDSKFSLRLLDSILDFDFQENQQEKGDSSMNGSSCSGKSCHTLYKNYSMAPPSSTTFSGRPDAVVLTVQFPFSSFTFEEQQEDSSTCNNKEKHAQDDTLFVKVETCPLQEATLIKHETQDFPTINTSIITPKLTLIYRSSQALQFQHADLPLVRYLEHAPTSYLGASLTPRQRSAVGFPPLGHPYWENDEALGECAKRYAPGFDPMPYLLARRGGKSMKNDKTTPGKRMEMAQQLKLPPPPQGARDSCDPEETYLDPARLVHPDSLPSSATRGQDEIVLSPDQIAQFHNEGYLFVDNVFPSDVLDRAIQASEDLWPKDMSENSLLQPPKLKSCQLSPRAFSFPFRDMRLNAITLHPRLLTLMSQLLECSMENVRIMQSACFAKRAAWIPPPATDPKDEQNSDQDEIKTSSAAIAEGMSQDEGFQAHANDDTDAANQDLEQQVMSKQVFPKCTTPGNQPMHLDFANNTLLTPARSKFHWSSQVEEVQGILYYTHHQTSGGGGTSYVPGLSHSGVNPVHGGWLPDNPNDLSATDDEDPRDALYQVERRVAFTPGSLLLFQLGTWHRGTPLMHLNEQVTNGTGDGVRRIHHLCFRRSDVTWVGGATDFGEYNMRSLRELQQEEWDKRQQINEQVEDGVSLETFLAGLSPVQKKVLGVYAR